MAHDKVHLWDSVKTIMNFVIQNGAYGIRGPYG